MSSDTYYFPVQKWISSKIQGNDYFCPTQKHTTPKSGRLGVVTNHVYDPYRSIVCTATQYNWPCMCVSITYLLIVFTKYSQIFLSLKRFSYSSSQLRSDFFITLPRYFPLYRIVTHNFQCHHQKCFCIWSSMVYFHGIPSTWHPCYQHTKIYIVYMATSSEKVSFWW